jgi:superfamily II DNA or RNA helicase
MVDKRLVFQGGTLVLYGAEQSDPVPDVFRWIKARWRAPAYHYAHLLPWLRDQGVRDQIPRWSRLNYTLQDPREAHDYQETALAAWHAADRRGSIVLPTGAGKTFVAIRAVHEVNRSTVIVAPTIDLMHQWYARLVNAFSASIGVYYGGEKQIAPVTVTTYHSAGDLIADHGNQFKCIIFDEVHHLPAPSWGETALMAPAPFRLGLTATYPTAAEQADGRWNLDDLIGPITYALHIDDLAGRQLAEYRTERIRVDLTHEERTAYEQDYQIYADYFRQHQLHRKHGPRWLMELMRRSAFDNEARRALLARQRLQRLVAHCTGKRQILDDLLREYNHEHMLIFTEHNSLVYQIAQDHFIPAITHETQAAERKHILDAFQSGHYRAIVTSKVLNEGIDVPEAKVAVVLGGGVSSREYIQRLGRVLRKAGNRQAILIEVIARRTVDEGKAQRRRANV